MAIRFFDMFSGIGGFRSGLERIDGFECIGHCEIDKYANQAYNAMYQPKGELFYEDARTINPDELPDTVAISMYALSILRCRRYIPRRKDTPHRRLGARCPKSNTAF